MIKKENFFQKYFIEIISVLFITFLTAKSFFKKGLSPYETFGISSVAALLAFFYFAMTRFIYNISRKDKEDDKNEKEGRWTYNVLMVVTLPLFLLLIALLVNDHINFTYDVDFDKLKSVGSILAPIMTFCTIGLLVLSFLTEMKKHRENIDMQNIDRKLQSWETTIKDATIRFNEKLGRLELYDFENERDLHGDEVIYHFIKKITEFLIQFNRDGEAPIGVAIMGTGSLHLFDDCVRLINLLNVCPKGKGSDEYLYMKDYVLLLLPIVIADFMMEASASRLHNDHIKDHCDIVDEFFYEYRKRSNSCYDQIRKTMVKNKN